MCRDGQFGTVCSQSWTNKDASVACRGLGYSPYGKKLSVPTSCLLCIQTPNCRHIKNIIKAPLFQGFELSKEVV